MITRAALRRAGQRRHLVTRMSRRAQINVSGLGVCSMRGGAVRDRIQASGRRSQIVRRPEAKLTGGSRRDTDSNYWGLLRGLWERAEERASNALGASGGEWRL